MLRNGRYISIASRTIWICFLFSLAALTCAHIHASSFYRIKLRWCEKSKIRWMHRRKQGAMILDSRFVCRRRAVRTKTGEHRAISRISKGCPSGLSCLKKIPSGKCVRMCWLLQRSMKLDCLLCMQGPHRVQCNVGKNVWNSIWVQPQDWEDALTKKLKQDCCNNFNICWLFGKNG